jgi:hypothetical protein
MGAAPAKSVFIFVAGALAVALLGCGTTKARAYCERTQECAGASDPSRVCDDLERAGVLSVEGDRCAAEFEAWADCAHGKATCESHVLVLGPDDCKTQRAKLDQCRGVNPLF